MAIANLGAAIDEVISVCRQSGGPADFQGLAAAVQSTRGITLTYKELTQLAYVVPEAYHINWIGTGQSATMTIDFAEGSPVDLMTRKDALKLRLIEHVRQFHT
jgi:hypothetical protein